MTDIVLGIAMFTLTVMVLSLAVMAARAVLAPPAIATVTINGETKLAARTQQKLLEVLHGNGILIPSACAGAGTCGLCKVAVTDGGGEVLPTERSKLDRQEIRAGIRLACQVRVRGDLAVQIPDDLLGTNVWDCTVASEKSLAPFIREVVLALPEGEDLQFRAGSFVQITAPPHKLSFADFEIPSEYEAIWRQMSLRELVSGSKAEVTRAYSIANRPEDKGRIVLNIRLALPPPSVADAPPGIVSSYLFGVRAGDTVRVTGPYGNFTAKDTGKEMVFIGGGVGMAPLRAIIFDQLQRVGTDRRMSFWYGARSKAELYYEDEFEALQKKHSNFSWTVALSDPKPEDDWNGPTGFIHNVAYHDYLKDHPAPEDCEYYLCGPPLMIRAVMKMLQDIGVERDSIFYDDFGG